MKKSILMIFLIVLGFTITLYTFNSKFYAKENFSVYAFQAGIFDNGEKANTFLEKLPTGIVIEEDNLYKVYVGIYKDIDVVNKMLSYYKKNNINVYLKNIRVQDSFYNYLNNYETIFKESDNEILYKKVNQTILNTYLEGINNA